MTSQHFLLTSWPGSQSSQRGIISVDIVRVFLYGTSLKRPNVRWNKVSPELLLGFPGVFGVFLTESRMWEARGAVRETELGHRLSGAEFGGEGCPRRAPSGGGAEATTAPYCLVAFVRLSTTAIRPVRSRTAHSCYAGCVCIVNSARALARSDRQGLDRFSSRRIRIFPSSGVSLVLCICRSLRTGYCSALRFSTRRITSSALLPSPLRFFGPLLRFGPPSPP